MMSNQIGSLVVAQQPSAVPTLARPFPIGAGKDRFGFGFQIETAPVAEKEIVVVVLMQLLPYYDEASLKIVRGFEHLVYQQLR
ncbi:MAG: hypothetical protein AUH43_20525 [Acidobacteria bacterium 13_1_40CM_65_14]|nr:MAG: hypothetical protein AUH43_20525 [Acidobacteria bacterium 13_1_40CM_65_14]